MDQIEPNTKRQAFGPTWTQAPVTAIETVARDTVRLRCHSPSIARSILPGQFVMMRASGRLQPLLGRPLAMYDTADDEFGEPTSIDVVFWVQGAGTRTLSGLAPGQLVDVWGPLGTGFPLSLAAPFHEHVLLVAGGIGQTPFLAVAKHYLGRRVYGMPPTEPTLVRPKRISLAYGARSADRFAGLEDFRQAGVELVLATDDGSAGHAGRVTDCVATLLASSVRPTAVFGCGPEAMLVALARQLTPTGIPLWVSLENRMGCGYGVCFSCVCPVNLPTGGWDYERVCIAGPVFPSAQVAWPILADQTH